ncbi:peptidoglycan-binding protein [Streptomyces sp. NPDC012461]|uniref:peptidoglycan-binding domain-containing protein n=1 Tax=Streptomyces sp. NPDC012461 TaxID=3155117 RepID=UPI0033D929F0
MRAADALRDARTAEAAAAEDFDPLRIRPYVELDGTAGEVTPDEAAGKAAAGEDATRPADATMALRAVTPEAAAAGRTPGPANAPGAPAPSGAPGPAGNPGPAGASDATSVLPTPLAPPTSEPSATDLHLFEGPHPADGTAGSPVPATADGTPATAGPGRRRRTALLSAAGAVVLVIGAAGWASGLFAYETPSRDGALPDDVRASVPDAASSPPPSSAPAAGPSTAPSASASASASPSDSASPSASPSPSETASADASASASPSEAEPSASPSAATPGEAAPGDGDGNEGEATAPVLRRGDRGPEVVELQLRLRQLFLYNDEIHGQFDRRVEEALRTYQWARGLRGEMGTYGPQTRTRLESETRQP